MIKKRVTNELNFIAKVCIGCILMAVLSGMASLVLGEVLADKELEFVTNQQEFPRAMLELIGMQELQQFPSQVEVFFLLLLVSNLLIMGVIIAHSVHMMRQGISQGAFGFLFMQITKQSVYFITEVLRILCVAWLTWGVYVVAMILTGSFLTKDVDVSVIANVSEVLSTMAAWGAGVVMMLVAFATCYGIKQEYSMHATDFGIVIMGISFVLGNAYKIPQYIGQKQMEQMINAQQTMEVMRMMKQFRFMCPFAWLNPFNIYNHALDEGIIWGYIGIAVLVFVVVGVVFGTRDWWEV